MGQSFPNVSDRLFLLSRPKFWILILDFWGKEKVLIGFLGFFFLITDFQVFVLSGFRKKIIRIFVFLLNNNDVKNYGGFKSFGYIYIYIDYAKNIKDTRVKVDWLSHYQSLKSFSPSLATITTPVLVFKLCEPTIKELIDCFK